jgi:4-hydroxybenzoate polyprenyltransferase
MSSRPLAHPPLADALSLFEALRPRQWIKNLIVLAPAFFHFKLQAAILWPSLAFTALFCLISSAFYLVNDVADREKDRQHPKKRFRPIASGRVGAAPALCLAALLLTAALGVAWRISLPAFLMLIIYCLLQFMYNLWAKHVVLLDLLCIAAGFVIRAGSGAAASQIPLSPWFLLCVGLLAVFLGLEKRKAEIALAAQSPGTRSVLEDYSRRLLDRMEQVVVSGGVVTYALWSAGPHLKGAPTPAMMLTLPAVLYAVFRYQWLSEQGHDTERPEDLVLADKPLLWAGLCWMATAALVLAGHSAGMVE